MNITQRKMDYNDQNEKMSVSVLQGDGFYFDRILSRDSSVGRSSRIYYGSTAEGVPFKWEKQPGTPKIPARKEVIPPPTPPPAAQSLGLSRPCLDQPKDSMGSRGWWFWKKSKKRQHNKKKVQRGDGHSRSDSSSSSSSFSSVQQPRHVPFSCSPWNLTQILVCVARRV